MIVQVIDAHGEWAVGDVIPDMPPNAGRALIAQGLVRELVPRKTKQATK